MQQTPTIGRTVLYRLTEKDAAQINRRRTTGESIRERLAEGSSEPRWPVGAQAHIGNPVNAGDIVPLVITRTWHIEGHYTRHVSLLNGQAQLDGTDTFWVTSVAEGEGEYNGEWFWPPRV